MNSHLYNPPFAALPRVWWWWRVGVRECGQRACCHSDARAAVSNSHPSSLHRHPDGGAASPTLDETIVTTKRRCYSVSRRSSLFVCVSLNAWNDIDTVFGLLAFWLSWLHCTISILFLIRFIWSLKSEIYIASYSRKQRSYVISEILDFVHYFNQTF